jgi:hypothetical protein
MPLLSLPSEIILLIASQVDSDSDFLRLVLVNHFLHNLLIDRLYARDVSQTGGFALLFYSNWGYESSVQHMLAAGAKADIRGPLWGNEPPCSSLLADIIRRLLRFSSITGLIRISWIMLNMGRWKLLS